MMEEGKGYKEFLWTDRDVKAGSVCNADFTKVTGRCMHLHCRIGLTLSWKCISPTTYEKTKSIPKCGRNMREFGHFNQQLRF